MTKVIEIAKDFSDVPAGRFLDDGPHSGEAFRERLLVPALNANEIVKVVLDGVEGYGSSFLEEAFGGLVRVHKFDGAFLEKHLILVASSPEYELYCGIIRRYIDDALKFANAQSA